MGRYSLDEAADRAGVGSEYISDLVAAKLLTPEPDGTFSEGDARRAASLHAITSSGIPLQTFAQIATRMSLDFMDSPVYERFASISRETFRGVSERTGVPLDLLATIRETLGAPSPSPDDRMRDQELQIVPFLELVIRGGSNPQTLDRLLRVIGDSLRRVAETEADWYYHEVLLPQRARESADANGPNGGIEPDNSEALDAYIDRALLAMYHGQQGRTWMRNVIRTAGLQVSDAGLMDRPQVLPGICFLDITGYTRLTQEHGDAAAASLADELSRVVQRTSAQFGGRAIKWLGDGVMFYFDDPAKGVLAALEMIEGVGASGLPPAHVGIDCGPVTFQQGDYFGQTVILASRIADFARPGEVVVSESVASAAADQPVTFTEIGPVELKGVPGPLRLHIARRSA
ncbi:MAG: adenylate/guanylate cyclase domain-containing protein [Actinomycetes bacterium]